MQAKCRVAHQCDMNVICGAVNLILIEPVVVLRKARAITDGFTQSHRMDEPMRTPRPGCREAVVFRCENGTQEIILVIPIAIPTAEKQGEDGTYVVVHNLRRGGGVVIAPIAKAADGRVTAGTTTVGAQESTGRGW